MTSDNQGATRWARWGVALGLPAAALLGLALSTLITSAAAQEDETDPIDEIRTMNQQYVELRSQISKERAQAAETEQFLNDRLALVGQQIEIAGEATSESEGETAKNAERMEELVQQNEALKQATTSLESVIWDLEREVLELRGWMPLQLQDQIAPLAVKVPDSKEKADGLKLYDRFINVVGILNFIDKYNSGINVVSEQRDVAGDDAVAVSTMYIGVSVAYSANDLGTKAWRGRPSKDGFAWEPADEHAAAIQLAIAVAQGGKTAQFVQLPLSVD